MCFMTLHILEPFLTLPLLSVNRFSLHIAWLFVPMRCWALSPTWSLGLMIECRAWLKFPRYPTSRLLTRPSHILFHFNTFSVLFSFQAALVTGKFNLALSLIRKVRNNTDLSIKLDNGQNLAHVLARQANENTLAVRPHINLKFPRQYISLIQMNRILKQLQVENCFIWFNCLVRWRSCCWTRTSSLIWKMSTAALLCIMPVYTETSRLSSSLLVINVHCFIILYVGKRRYFLYSQGRNYLCKKEGRSLKKGRKRNIWVRKNWALLE